MGLVVLPVLVGVVSLVVGLVLFVVGVVVSSGEILALLTFLGLGLPFVPISSFGFLLTKELLLVRFVLILVIEVALSEEPTAACALVECFTLGVVI